MSDELAQLGYDLMRRKFDGGDVKTRTTYLSSVIDRIEVDDDAIRVFGRKDVLADAIARRNSPAGNVSGFVRKWRAIPPFILFAVPLGTLGRQPPSSPKSAGLHVAHLLQLDDKGAATAVASKGRSIDQL